MRLKITFTLLAILLGLLVYIFYIDTQFDRDDFQERRKSVLGELAVGIDHFSALNNGSGERISFELRNKRWMLTEPYEWPANEFAVERILTELRFLERVSSFDTSIVSSTGVSLRDYGLLPPRISLQFGRGNQSHTLPIGAPTEIGNNLYILSTDQAQVHVVDRGLLEALTVGLDNLRDPRLFQTAIFEVNSWNIQVRENNRNLRAWFARKDDRWEFETPIRARADTPAVNTLLNRCLQLEADAVVANNPGDLSQYGLQTSRYRIAIESSQQREVLEIGNKVSADSPFRYAKREDRQAVFQIRIDFLDLLANAQTKLRQRRIFELDVQAATAISVERRDEPPLTLQKLENGSWEIIARDQSQGIQTLKGDTATIEQILLWLDELKAVPDTGFVNDAPSAQALESYGLEVPEYSITITSDRRFGSEEILERPISETLHIGDRSPQEPLESFVKIQRKDFVYSVYNDIFERIDNTPSRYKDRTVTTLTPGSRISTLSIIRLSDKATLARYDYAEQADLPEQAATMADRLAKLQVESFRPEGFTRTVEIAGREKPWTYQIVAEIAREDSQEQSEPPLEIYVSELTGGPLLYGGIAQQEISFRFGIDFIDTFSSIVFDRIPQPVPQDPFSDEPLPETETAPTEETAAESP